MRPKDDVPCSRHLDVKSLVLHHFLLHSHTGSAPWTSCKMAPKERRLNVQLLRFSSSYGKGRILSSAISGRLLAVLFDSHEIGFCNLDNEEFTFLPMPSLPSRKPWMKWVDPFQHGKDWENVSSILFFRTRSGIKILFMHSDGGEVVFGNLRCFTIAYALVIFEADNVPFVQTMQECDDFGVRVLAAHAWPCLKDCGGGDRVDNFRIFFIRSNGELFWSKRSCCRDQKPTSTMRDGIASHNWTTEYPLRFYLIQPIEERPAATEKEEEEEEKDNYCCFDNRDPVRRHFKILSLADVYTSIGYDVKKHDSLRRPDVVKQLANIIESAYIFRDDVFVMIAAMTKKLLVSIDGRCYRVYEPLVAFRGGCVTTVQFSSSVFFLGTSNGLVLAYPVGESSDLLHLELTKPLLKYRNKHSKEVRSIYVNKITRWDRDIKAVEIAVAFEDSLEIISKGRVGELTNFEGEDECFCGDCDSI